MVLLEILRSLNFLVVMSQSTQTFKSTPKHRILLQGFLIDFPGVAMFLLQFADLAKKVQTGGTVRNAFKLLLWIHHAQKTRFCLIEQHFFSFYKPVEFETHKCHFVSIVWTCAWFEHFICLIVFSFTNIALCKEQSHFFVVDLGKKSFAQETRICKQFKFYWFFDGFEELEF